MEILVIDGQGGGLGRQLVAAVKKAVPQAVVTAIGTNSVDRAVYHLGLQGVKCLEETRKTDGKGKTKAIYLDGTFGGFAIHLVQK